jgi:NAD(P)H-hydrate epimerase
VKGLPRRKADTHKGDYGRVLVVAGSRGMCGAAVLAGLGAYRAGAGLVYHACPASVADVLSIKQDCAVVWPFREDRAAEDLLGFAARCDVAVVGPGLSQAPPIVDAVREFVASVEIPFVLDADGLNAFREHPDLLQRGHAKRVLTPHPGEAARLLGTSIEAVQADRRGAALQLATRFLAITVLKGHRTLITDGKRIVVNRTGNPGMATGGTGDVLAGVIGGLMGQELDPFDAAALGARVHGRAGDLAAKRVGETSLMATDLLEDLPRALKG